ncbi:hypothetical protein [Vibrio neptunius]|uniref:hypothetical protein n=1 Tax=Vibrio neptunius TaxID=170651 RepID=UPI003CE495CB
MKALIFSPIFRYPLKKSLTQAELSKNQVKKLDGINKHSESVRAYLIGQIGKNFTIPQNPISLPDILEEVYAIIEAAQALVGGRALPPLHRHYSYIGN